MKDSQWLHILNTSATFMLCQLLRMGKIRSFLSSDAANKLAVYLILSRLNHCGSLLAGVTDNTLNKLRRIQNHVAWLVLVSPGMHVQQHY